MSEKMTFKGPLQPKPVYGSVCHLVVEGCQIDLVWFPLHKLMVTIPHHLPFIHKFGNGFQEYLLHLFYRAQGEADCPVALLIQSLSLLQDRMTFLFSSLREATTGNHCDLSKRIESELGQLPWHL